MLRTAEACPRHLAELLAYMNNLDTRDPWGHEYRMLCGVPLPDGASGIAVWSIGPDGKAGTFDDLRSWR
jgi:hypothetical protein